MESDINLDESDNSDENSSKNANCEESNSADLPENVVISEKAENAQVDQENSAADSEKTEVSASDTFDYKHVSYVGDVAVYTDPASGYQYKWENEKWVPNSENVTYGFENDTHTYTDAEGMTYLWDKEKSAWFPNITTDFMAQYQMNYGFVDNKSEDAQPKEAAVEVIEKPKEAGVKRKPSIPSWFEVDQKTNSKVYVSNLPLDITEDEFAELMQKCGIVERDVVTQKLKLKLYTEPGTKELKGDGICTYIRVESVELALKLLDGYDVRGKKIKVEPAKFQMKGKYDPKMKPKTKKRKEKEKLKLMQAKLFDWRPEKQRGERSKHEKVVIVKNVFESSMFDVNVGLILELQEDMTEECSKCGQVRKVTIFDRHPEGVVQINMKDAEEADAVVTLLNGRWFGQRKLTAETWDGKTKYKIAETDSQISQRMDKWDEFLTGVKNDGEVSNENKVDDVKMDNV